MEKNMTFEEVIAASGVELVNLTPHDVTLVAKNGETFTIPATGDCARVGVSSETIGSMFEDMFDIVRTVFDREVVGLPAPQDGVIYLVSTLVAQASPSRRDLLVPANLVRDEAGRVVGAGALQRFCD